MANVIGNCKNRMVIVEEDLHRKCCKVYGLDSNEESLVQERLEEDTYDLDEWPNHHLNMIGRASDIIPILESLGYEFYSIADNFATAQYCKFTWRLMKKISK